MSPSRKCTLAIYGYQFRGLNSHKLGPVHCWSPVQRDAHSPSRALPLSGSDANANEGAVYAYEICHCVMRCSVVFGVTLRILVINISSSSPAINTAAYYQRCVTTCETVAVVHRRSCLQHLVCSSVNTDSKAKYRLIITISAYPTCIRRPR